MSDYYLLTSFVFKSRTFKLNLPFDKNLIIFLIVFVLRFIMTIWVNRSNTHNEQE